MSSNPVFRVIATTRSARPIASVLLNSRHPSGLSYALAVLALVFSNACASVGGTPRPFPTGPGGATPAAGRDLPAGSVGIDPKALVATALALRGVPYRNGGVGPAGFDCSGFTQYVFGRHGLALPREVRNQFRAGVDVAQKQLKPGDLLFFSTTVRGPSHVAIAVGGAEFIHAPSSTGVVRIERLDSRYWATRFIGIRRVTTR